MELYYANAEGEYWKQKKSLPYAVLIRDVETRMKLEKILLADGFKCVVYENEYPCMYVNFVLKRFGRNVKACKSSSVNSEPITYEEFMENVYKRHKSEPEFRKS